MKVGHHRGLLETAGSTAPRKRAFQPRILLIYPYSQRAVGHADQRMSERRGHRPGMPMVLGRGSGAARGMSSFHEAFHGNASNVVQSGDAALYMQLRRGAPGRIRTCAPASGDR